MLKDWDELPKYMRTDEVRPYYDKLKKKKVSLFIKRVFDITASLVLLIVLLPVFVVVSILIKKDSKGPIFFRQERVTQYGRKFKIHKFRTMVPNAESKGTQVTISNDSRVTKVGKVLRKYRIDEFPQLIDILKGDMTFVGTRPEVTKYVEQYTPEMYATLLLPAGVTSEASIKYKDEESLLHFANDIDEVYINNVLTEKMKYNLNQIKTFNTVKDFYYMIKTLIAVIK